eukprot:m.5235 g.5235  ORF g.5235 m.5235 type:complete len:68 (-) comp2363_c0_seq1:4259-4462(-)
MNCSNKGTKDGSYVELGMSAAEKCALELFIEIERHGLEMEKELQKLRKEYDALVRKRDVFLMENDFV